MPEGDAAALDALLSRLEADQRGHRRRRVAAFKLGLEDFQELRGYLQERSEREFSGPAADHQARVFGIAVYVVGRPRYYEAIYEDEGLRERLAAEPAALWPARTEEETGDGAGDD